MHAVCGQKKPFFLGISPLRSRSIDRCAPSLTASSKSACYHPNPASAEGANSRRVPDMKKTLAAFVAAAAIAGSSLTPTPASAQRGVAAGVAAGLIGGAIVGGAIASSRPAYGGPVYVEEPPPCRMVRERFWDGYGWRFRRVEVCD
jgi:hypothetical protein